MTQEEQLTLMDEIEQELTDIQGSVFIANDMYGSTEKIDFKKIIQGLKTTSKRLYELSARMYRFSKSVKDFAMNKIVSEKTIHLNFNNMAKSIQDIQLHRAYVSKVPTFQVQRSRFLGLIKLVGHIEEMSKNPADSLPDGERFMNRLADLSNGVLIVSKANPGSDFKNLKWNPPQLMDYEIKTSPWYNTNNVDTMRNLALTCKYDMAEKLQDISRTIVDRCEEARKGFSSDMGSYDDMDDMGSYQDMDQEMSNVYSLSYYLEKAIMQTMTEGLRKEVNIFTNTYVKRLSKFKFQ